MNASTSELGHPSQKAKWNKNIDINSNRRRPRRNQLVAFVDKPVDLQPTSLRRNVSETLPLRLRRAAMSPFSSLKYTPDILQIGQAIKGKDWLRSFQSLDPRLQILKFFNDLSLEGVENFESKRGSDARRSSHVSKLLRGFSLHGMFTVWRPTSPDAIAKMITGEGTGKGLDIKGKSALRGPFSGFVPFLQIGDNAHKFQVGSMEAHKRVRVFYPDEVSRDAASTLLYKLCQSMVDRLSADATNVEERIRFHMDDPKVHNIESGTYGIDMPEKLLWEGYVLQHDITRPQGSKYDTGRPSIPAFQQMNIDTLRSWGDMESSSPSHEGDPRPVLWHEGCSQLKGQDIDDYNLLCPQGLLMAYEENGNVTPVVSDFDCFLLGTRGVKYEKPFGEHELAMLSRCIEEIDGILSTAHTVSWTTRWLEVKKKLVRDEQCCQEMPRYGYADPRSYSIIKGAVQRLKSNGAVRHGPECFNYVFPQELDSQYLVISDTFPGVPWRYVGCEELISILCEKIDQGFTFPLNPKWVLCDPGWKRVYDKLLASQKPNVQDSINIWYPSHIRARIEEISTKFPKGFDSNLSDFSTPTRTLAEFELKKYMICLSSKKKLRSSLSKHSRNLLSSWKFQNELQRLCDSHHSQEECPDDTQGPMLVQKKTKAALAA